MKKRLEAKLREVLERDAKSAPIDPESRFAKDVLHAAPPAPRDITKPLAGMAREIDLAHIKPDPSQPRKTINRRSLEQLAASIRAHGVLQPVTVYWSEEQAGYILLTGERRFRASQLAGMKSIPAIIRPAAPDEQAKLQQQLVENIQRENIPPLEEAIAVKALMEGFNLSQVKLSEQIGKPRTYVVELLNILRIPEALLGRAVNLPKHALIEISRVKDPRAQERFLERLLESPAPAKEAREARRKKSNGSHRRDAFRATYQVDGFPTVTLTLDTTKPPKRKDLVALLKKIIRLIEAS